MAASPVIYAEDDRDDAFFMQLAFEQAEIENPLVVLFDGQEVIDYLGHTGKYADRDRHPAPKALLLDLKLPRKTGFDVLRWMAESRLYNVQVIVVSSSGQALDVELAKKMGASDYIIKPSSPTKLFEIVQRFKAQWID